MNVYDILNNAARRFAEPATLTKRDGTALTIAVVPETNGTETIGDARRAAVNVASFSIDVADLTNAEGVAYYPQEGDVLSASFGSTTRRWVVVKDAETGRSWDWFWARPGARVKVKARGTE